jgi:NAD(P)-dependent dehydrogenase (short-subunit alcohol dehydrogenase family)
MEDVKEEIAMQDKRVALVTGANKGIGLQIANDLVAHGFIVLVGSRSLERGDRAAKSIGADARALQLDVTNQTSIAAAAERIRNEFGRLDVLVNNAAISHAGKPGRPLEEMAKSGRLSFVSLDEVRAVFETNVFGVMAVTQAMLPLLREASGGRIVNVSSSSGSLTLNADPKNPHGPMFGTYFSSKTALNAITLAFASAPESIGIEVNAAREPVRLALLDVNGPTDTFSNEDGSLRGDRNFGCKNPVRRSRMRPASANQHKPV